MGSHVHEDFTTYSQSMHSDVLLPTVTHADFLTNKAQQNALLTMLYNKMAIEHRTSKGGWRQLFLSLDTQRTGVLTKDDFAASLAKLGAPLSPQQVDWVVDRLDLDHDGRVRYEEFARSLGAWRGTQPGPITGLTWDFERNDGSPFKAADEQRKANQQVVLEKMRQSLSLSPLPPRRAGAEDIGWVLASLRRAIYERDGSMKKAFEHWDRDHDKRLSKQDLADAVREEEDVELSPEALDRLFERFDVDKDGKCKYWEFVRAMQEDEEEGAEGAREGAEPAQTEEEGASQEEPIDYSLPSTSVMLPADAEAAEGMTDEEVLRCMAASIHDRGLHAHRAIKQLVPEAGGSLDAKWFRTLGARLGVPISQARAQRMLQKSDLLKVGRLTSWELVRMLSEAVTEAEGAAAMSV